MIIDDSNKCQIVGLAKQDGINCLFIEKNNYPYLADTETIKMICTRLLCKEVRSLILTGPPGSGKSSLVRYLANFFDKVLYPELNNIQILSLDVSSTLAGSEFRGSFEKKVNSILDLCQQYENLVLFFDEAHCLSNTSIKDGIGILDILKPRIIGTNLRIILSTTDDELNNLDYDKAFMRRVHRIKVPRLSPVQIQAACQAHFKHLMNKHQLKNYNELSLEALNLQELIDSEADLHKIIDLMDFKLAGWKIDECF